MSDTRMSLFVGGPLDGRVAATEDQMVHAPIDVPGDPHFQKFTYVPKQVCCVHTDGRTIAADIMVPEESPLNAEELHHLAVEAGVSYIED